MTVGQIIKELKKLNPELELQVSVDMSVEGNEDTYADRVFGLDAYLVREVVNKQQGIDFAQILFERNESSFPSKEKD